MKARLCSRKRHDAVGLALRAVVLALGAIGIMIVVRVGSLARAPPVTRDHNEGWSGKGVRAVHDNGGLEQHVLRRAVDQEIAAAGGLTGDTAAALQHVRWIGIVEGSEFHYEMFPMWLTLIHTAMERRIIPRDVRVTVFANNIGEKKRLDLLEAAPAGIASVVTFTHVGKIFAMIENANKLAKLDPECSVGEAPDVIILNTFMSALGDKWAKRIVTEAPPFTAVLGLAHHCTYYKRKCPTSLEFTEQHDHFGLLALGAELREFLLTVNQRVNITSIFPVSIPRLMSDPSERESLVTIGALDPNRKEYSYLFDLVSSTGIPANIVGWEFNRESTHAVLDEIRSLEPCEKGKIVVTLWGSEDELRTKLMRAKFVVPATRLEGHKKGQISDTYNHALSYGIPMVVPEVALEYLATLGLEGAMGLDDAAVIADPVCERYCGSDSRCEPLSNLQLSPQRYQILTERVLRMRDELVHLGTVRMFEMVGTLLARLQSQKLPHPHPDIALPQVKALPGHARPARIPVPNQPETPLIAIVEPHAYHDEVLRAWVELCALAQLECKVYEQQNSNRAESGLHAHYVSSSYNDMLSLVMESEPSKWPPWELVLFNTFASDFVKDEQRARSIRHAERLLDNGVSVAVLLHSPFYEQDHDTIDMLIKYPKMGLITFAGSMCAHTRERMIQLGIDVRRLMCFLSCFSFRMPRLQDDLSAPAPTIPLDITGQDHPSIYTDTSRSVAPAAKYVERAGLVVPGTMDPTRRNYTKLMHALHTLDAANVEQGNVSALIVGRVSGWKRLRNVVSAIKNHNMEQRVVVRGDVSEEEFYMYLSQHRFILPCWKDRYRTRLSGAAVSSAMTVGVPLLVDSFYAEQIRDAGAGAAVVQVDSDEELVQAMQMSSLQYDMIVMKVLQARDDALHSGSVELRRLCSYLGQGIPLPS
eukprot:TRINITY_DN1664_c0_g1_i3.p1 TRINITY_DN1664_c0_g1~~TRINITY_DN1664_c0_g1_i3.p1  ORF type:complete len:928 (-),score=118.50 TRINITY_DN1664_c0_g1_i3:301-3084(-)